jgi:hypothetical protein
MTRVESERTEPLSAVLQRDGTKTIYAVDFGDNWEHDILLEKWLPPENGGGIPGYYDLLDAVADSCYPRHEEPRDWIGDEFNPEAFPSTRSIVSSLPHTAATKAPPVNP